MKELLASPAGLLAAWLVCINAATFAVYGADKRRARRGAWRVPERTLFLLSAIGGSVGALLGMRVFHHKTLHRSFRIGVPVILMLQIIVPVGLWVYWRYFR